MSEREKLLMRIQVMDFAMLETNLFLDSHPNNQEALALHEKYKQSYEMLVAEYESKYGPIKLNTDSREKTWAWIKDPWPWDYMGGR